MYFVIKEIQSKFTCTLPMLFTRLPPKLSRMPPKLFTRALYMPITRTPRKRTPPHITHMPMFKFALTFTPPHITHMPITMLTQSTYHPHITRISISLAHRLHIACISLACCFAFVDSSLRSPAETFSARHLAGLLTCPRATPSSRFPERTTSSSDSLSVETVTSVGCPMKKDLQLRV